MTDRESFLSSILASPDDDISRLAFADWLDEYGTDDSDTASAEFIRLSCSLDATKERQTAPEGRWLDAHWHRLLPTLDGWNLHRRSGRVLHLTKVRRLQVGNVTTGQVRTVEYTKWLIVTFWRGFASNAWTYQIRDLDAIRLVARCQPLAALSIQDVLVVQADGTSIFASALKNTLVPNDVFTRIRGADFASLTVKTFENYGGEMGQLEAQTQAQSALSDAIRGWSLSAVDVPPASG